MVSLYIIRGRGICLIIYCYTLILTSLSNYHRCRHVRMKYAFPNMLITILTQEGQWHRISYI